MKRISPSAVFCPESTIKHSYTSLAPNKEETVDNRMGLISFAFLSGLIATVAVVFLLAWPSASVRADPDICYVAPGGDCGGASPCYASVQDCVDVASDGDLIKVATGTYTEVQGRLAPPEYDGPSIITQVVYISKSVIIRGGYTTAFSDPNDPEANPTTLDAQGGGRVLFVSGEVSPTIEGLRLTGGDATGLGGYYDYLGIHDVGGGMYVETASPNIRDNQMFNNTAEVGGGLFLHRSDAAFSGNTVTLNTASDSGGGLFLGCGGSFLYESSATLSGNTISANTANGTGGGLCLVNNSDATLVNNLVADNQANNPGSGLHIAASAPHLLHNTIARNSGGDGRGIHVTDYTDCPGCDYYYSTVALTNTILVSQAVGINVTAGNTATLEATLWGSGSWANGTDWGGGGTILTSTVNLWSDPDFVDPDNGDYHIGPDSAALDAGVDGGVTVDIDNQPRPIGIGYDIGADEYHLSSQLTLIKQASPDPVQSGAQLTYTLRVTNTGNVTLTATVTDVLPDHCIPTGVLSWTPTISVPGGVWMEQVVVTVELGYSGLLTNVVQVTTEQGAAGVYTETSEVQVTPKLEMTKRAAPDPVEAGKRLTYTLRVTNTGNVTLTATITDVLPDHCSPSGVLTWTPTIPLSGGVWTEQVVVTAAEGYSGTLINVLQVTTQEGATGIYTETCHAITVKYLVYLPLVARDLQPTATTGNVVITEIFFDGEGSNEPDEYVEIHNDDTVPVQLAGWTLRDEAEHIFTFPDHVMQPGQVCRIYTNEDHPEWCGFNYGSPSPIWNNTGDAAYLRDSDGTLVDFLGYATPG